MFGQYDILRGAGSVCFVCEYMGNRPYVSHYYDMGEAILAVVYGEITHPISYVNVNTDGYHGERVSVDEFLAKYAGK